MTSVADLPDGVSGVLTVPESLTVGTNHTAAVQLTGGTGAATPTLAVTGAQSSLIVQTRAAGTGVTLQNDADTDTLTIIPGTGGAGPVLTASGPESLVSMTFTSQGNGSRWYFTTPGNTDQLSIQTSTGGSGPDIYAGGSQTTTHLNLWAKGPYGIVYLASINAQGGSNLALMPGNYSGAAPGPSIAAAGTATDVPLVLVGKGAGTIVAISPISLGAAGPTLSSGTGAPTATLPNASLYCRADGAAGSSLYISRGGGTWAAIA